MPQFHPPGEFLTDYAAGSASWAVSLFVASHLALCPNCRAEVRALERAGADMFEHLTPEAFGRPLPIPGDREPLLAANSPQITPLTGCFADLTLPEPLRSHLITAQAAPAWRRLMPGLSDYVIPMPQDVQGPVPYMLQIAPGQAMPRHSHRGSELTLVLEGGFSDASGHYGRGDVEFADDQIDHQPKADRGPHCVCLVVTDASLRFTGPIGKILNWLF